MGKILTVILVTYLVIGVLVFIAQMALPGFIRPGCSGTASLARIEHTLTDRYFPPDDDTDALRKTRTGEKDITDIPWIFRVALHVVQWLPDLYREVIVGKMPVRDYLLGGYKCHPIKNSRFGDPWRSAWPIRPTAGDLAKMIPTVVQFD